MGEVLMTAKRRRRDLSEETASCNGKLQDCRASVIARWPGVED